MIRTRVRNAVGIVAGAAAIFAAASCGDSTNTTIPTYAATLTGAGERPTPKTTPATGQATFVDRGSEIDYTLTINGATNVVMSHIHAPAGVDATAPVIINLFIPNNPTGTLSPIVVTGSITDANNISVSLDSLRTLFNNGNAYVNVHTSANPAGEIRGQVARSQ